MELLVNNTFFTADTHFEHARILEHCNRPYDTVTEMNEDLVKRWNAIVKPNDIVYHLGDFAWRDHYKWINQLNGKVILITGNHDKMNVVAKEKFFEIHTFLERKINGQEITLCHYPLSTFNKIWHGAWHLYGHVHGVRKERDDFPACDVGVDVWDFQPVHFDVIQDKMKDIKEFEKTFDWKLQMDINRAELFGINQYYLEKFKK